ncbi:hypothetical protein UFOVP309_14 [uncultured Caudovirales phage]|uniref:Uncharacterized protein n=1 Tax=uncultured Caudovirales phage TaxID=2100421 RepID=A0A6J5LU43_9CAUD|nr:hypothetical protein UFOVP309_14 [uncultured Caudovirales phage]CAB4173075.1 hypothetical protein UFOVP946_21 [uncultured Caudovirales phage]
MKTEIIESLDILFSLQKDSDTYQKRLITKIKNLLVDEWNASDEYASEIRAVLDMDVTYEQLNNIKIR